MAKQTLPQDPTKDLPPTIFTFPAKVRDHVWRAACLDLHITKPLVGKSPFVVVAKDSGGTFQTNALCFDVALAGAFKPTTAPEVRMAFFHGLRRSIEGGRKIPKLPKDLLTQARLKQINAMCGDGEVPELIRGAGSRVLDIAEAKGFKLDEPRAVVAILEPETRRVNLGRPRSVVAGVELMALAS